MASAWAGSHSHLGTPGKRRRSHPYHGPLTSEGRRPVARGSPAVSQAVATAAPDAIAVAAGTTCADAIAAADLPTTGPTAIVAVRDADGQLRDLAWTPDADTVVTPVPIGSRDGLN